jgi:membrane dipeptidase
MERDTERDRAALVRRKRDARRPLVVRIGKGNFRTQRQPVECGRLKPPAFASPACDDILLSREAERMVKRLQLIDMLAPFTLELTRANLARRLTERERADWRRSGVTMIHHAQGSGAGNPFQNMLTFYAGSSAFIARNSDVFIGYSDVSDIDRAKQTGRIAVMLGVQNSEHFRSVEDVQLFHDLGQRVSQLTYNRQNFAGSGSTERIDGGVSDYGAALIREMNRVGMLVDMSHGGPRTMLDVVELSAQPVANSHSTCRALNDHVRATSDEVIRKMAAKGGVMGIASFRIFVTAAEPTTIEDYVNHIDHVAQLVGIDHVGIGTDSNLYGYDAMDQAISDQIKAFQGPLYKFRERQDIDGLNTPTKYVAIVDRLLARGYSDADVAKVMGGNFRRLLHAVQRNGGA